MDCIAQVVFFSTAGCMAAQIHREKKYQLQLEADSQAFLHDAPPGQQMPPGQHSAMAGAPSYDNWGQAPPTNPPNASAPPYTGDKPPPAQQQQQMPPPPAQQQQQMPPAYMPPPQQK